jgi:hypothetical protein
MAAAAAANAAAAAAAYAANAANAANANAHHQHPYPTTGGGYRGVSFDPATGLWRARLYCWGKHVTLGRFGTAEEAAFMHDRAAVFVNGPEGARTNFGVERASLANASSAPSGSWRVMSTLEALAREAAAKREAAGAAAGARAVAAMATATGGAQAVWMRQPQEQQPQQQLQQQQMQQIGVEAALAAALALAAAASAAPAPPFRGGQLPSDKEGAAAAGSNKRGAVGALIAIASRMGGVAVGKVD